MVLVMRRSDLVPLLLVMFHVGALPSSNGGVWGASGVVAGPVLLRTLPPWLSREWPHAMERAVLAATRGRMIHW